MNTRIFCLIFWQVADWNREVDGLERNSQPGVIERTGPTFRFLLPAYQNAIGTCSRNNKITK